MTMRLTATVRTFQDAVLACLIWFLPPLLAFGQDSKLEKNGGALPGEELAPAVDCITMQFPGDQWRFFSGKKDAVLSDTWTVGVDAESSQPMLICKGEPYGYILTTREFKNFQLGLDWKYPTDANGNSGILLFTTGDNRIWPTSLQVQLHQPEAGSTFPGGGAKSDNELRNLPLLAKPVNQWNQCLIVCQNGSVTVTINGQRVGEVTGCQPNQGAIALQSEGSEVHFRKMWIRELAPAPAKERTGSTRILQRRSEFDPALLFLAPDRLWINGAGIKRKTPLVTRSSPSQAARGEKRLNAEWVRLQTFACDQEP